MRRQRGIGLLAVFSALACADLPATTANGPPPRPPPEIGSSITHSQMCSCRACERAGCCNASEDLAPPPEACGASYDFSATAGCGIQVESCASRCFERVWRARSSEECDAKRPAECCG